MELNYAGVDNTTSSDNTATGRERFLRYIAGHTTIASRAQRTTFIPQHIPYSETPESNFPHENDHDQAGNLKRQIQPLLVDSGKHLILKIQP
jgi:hypothetical protein